MTEDATEAGRFGLIIVGDELLSGKRQDRHLAAVIERLDARGLELGWAWMLGDDADLLRRHFERSFAQDLPVLVTGGIGATPDDCTRQAAAAALGLPLEIHPEAAAVIVERWGEAAYPNRIHMAEFPRGASLIPNPVNRVAGFSLHHHHFVPGFPDMAWPMFEWVLDQHYRDRFRQARPVEHLLLVARTPESRLIPLMQQILADHPVKVSSLPNSQCEGEVELGVRGAAEAVDRAVADLGRLLDDLGSPWRDLGRR